MRKEIIINSAINEVRVAITEEGHLAEFFIEVPEREKLLGNIYYGQVSKIITGINAAFVDIGLSQDAFLHFSDVEDIKNNNEFDNREFVNREHFEQVYNDQNNINNYNNDELYLKQDSNNDNDLIEAELNDSDNIDKELESKKITKPLNVGNVTKQFAIFETKRSGNVIIDLQEGKEVLVQVIREAYSHKGMKVSTKISLPGRYVVLLPFEKVIGVSKKIQSKTERRRLYNLAKKALPDGFGCIVRTASVGKSLDELIADWENLLITWKKVEEKIEVARKMQEPMLVYQDMLLAASIIRDYFKDDIYRVVVDSKRMFHSIIEYLKVHAPNLVDKVELYTGITPIFEVLGIDKELQRTNKRVLSLSSGGDIVIDKTEALTVIDVNSGRSTETEQEKNAVKTNMEAIREIARQLRLRDIGGIIIIDFIDMKNAENRRRIFNLMKNEMKYDTAKIVVYPLTQLGLMQITRQRINQNLGEKVSDICPVCFGTGRIASKSELLNSIEKWLKLFRMKSNEFKITLLVHPQIAEYLTEGQMTIISRLMIKYFVKISVQQNDSISIDKFRVISDRKQKDITNEYLN